MKKRLFLFMCFFFIITQFVSGRAYAGTSLDEAKQLINKYYVHEVEQTVLEKSSINAMIDSLNDPYSTYMDTSSFKGFLSALDGSYAGVGMYIEQNGDNIQVINPIPGSPAQKAGIQPGDVLTYINDENITSLSVTEVASKIRGPQGSQVTITVKRDNKSIKLSLIRDIIQVSSVDYKLLEPRIGYIKLHSFTTQSPQEIEEALKDLISQGSESLVLDLRDNPGGLLNVAIDIAGYFVPKGPVVYVAQRGQKEQVYYTWDKPKGLPISVLVNERTASAAEILAGAIQDAKTGMIIGTTTFGKGSVQTIFTLESGEGLKLTTAKYLTRGRQDINGKGLTPDIYEVDQNKQLETAVNLLGGGETSYDVQLGVNSNAAFVGYRTYYLPVMPFLYEGKTMVPLRRVGEYLGFNTQWKNKKAVISLNSDKVIFDPATHKITKGNNSYDVDGKIIIKNGYTMIPVRLLEHLGVKVLWQNSTKIINIIKY